MSTTGKKVVTNAKKMITNGIVYAFGFKYKKLTKANVKAMAKLYPSYYSDKNLNLILKKVGKIAVDCSGYVCKAANIPHISSTRIQSTATEFWPVKNTSHMKSGMYIWYKGHVGLIEIDSTGVVWILEARNSTKNLQRTKLSSRGKYFTYYGKIKGVKY